MRNKNYWLGKITSDLKSKYNLEDLAFTKSEDNGKWEVINFSVDNSFYSVCKSCGFAHPTYKGNLFREYDYKHEYKYCPECGKKMHNRK